MTLSADDLADARRFAEESALRQGLPAKVEDPTALAKIAALFRTGARQREPAA